MTISTLYNTLKNLENDKQSNKEMNFKLEKEKIKIIEDDNYNLFEINEALYALIRNF